MQAEEVNMNCRELGMVPGTKAQKHARLYLSSHIFSSTIALLSLIYLSLVFKRLEVPFPNARTGSIDPDEAAAALLSSQPRTFPAPVQKLLTDLKEATRIADSGGLPLSYTAQEKNRWQAEHPCRARSELPPLFASKHEVKNVERNLEWEAVLQAYSDLHRTCIRKIGNLTDYFLEKSTVPGCKFVTGGSVYGLGNKISYAASIVLYAILTQRVVLFYNLTTSVPGVMCEPFEGSSWRLPEPLEYLNKRNVDDPKAPGNTTIDLFLDWVDRENGSLQHGSNLAGGKFYFTDVDDGWGPVERFFCDSEQDFLSQVRWISVAGCLYFTPKLFAITSFRPILEALFPDKMALTHLLRSVFLPNNIAWDRIQRNYDMFFRTADKRVSIQVRYRGGVTDHSNLQDSINAHTVQCLLENQILPNLSRSGVYDDLDTKYDRPAESPPPRTTKVLITSLYTDLRDLLQDMYLRHPTVTGESVGFLQLTHENDQQWGLEPDLQALVEIILLSLSDEILVTPLSTFGGVAQAYGGLKPWFVEHSNSTEVSCMRGPSVDMCYQAAIETFSCPYDLDVNNKLVYEHITYIEKCLAIDVPWNGLLLITT